MALSKIPSDLLEGAVSFNSAAPADSLTIDSSGNVGIGTSSPSSFYSLADNLVVGTGSSGNGISIYSGSADSGYIGFNDTATASMQGFIQYNHSGDYMAFAPNGSEKVRIDSAGRVTMPYQPAMHARLSVTTTFGANAIFVPTQTTVNIGGHYSSSNGLFTAPVAGLYQVSASFLVRSAGSSSSYLSVNPRINGGVTTTYGAIYVSSFSIENNCAGVFLIPLAANDTVGLVLGGNGNIELYPQENFMSIRLLG